MVTRLARWPAVLAAVALLLGWATSSAAQSQTRKVLILNSFEREFGPYSSYVQMLRAGLNRRSPAPLSFFEVSLQLALTPEQPREEDTVQYLRTILADQRPNLIVTIGSNAAAFLHRYRDRVFPAVPVLQAALNVRRVPLRRVEDNATSVSTADDFPQMVRNILDVLPQTERVFVVVGTSAFEQYWIREFKREFASFAGRVTFEWANDLSLDRILERAASLPPRSAILYVTLLVDATGAVQTDERVLAQLRAAANAPLFGQYDLQIGKGIVGGSLTSINASSGRAVDTALRLLAGEPPARIDAELVHRGPPTYDWRELQRWNIDEARLPRTSIVLLRPPSPWLQYRGYVVGTIAIVVMQSALIAGLVFQRKRRRRTEMALRASFEQNRDLAGRLISAQESERTRIARDLHDDVSQQIAAVSIMLSGLRRKVARVSIDTDVDMAVISIQERTATLAQSIRNLSHELHPGVLGHAGLVAALESHCADVAEVHGVEVSVRAGNGLEPIAADAALCLYRVAQEALTNAVRHGRARRIEVQVMGTLDCVELHVVDDGIGFAAKVPSGRGLGLRSIEERVRLVRGWVGITSLPGEGTHLHARLPREAVVVPAARAASSVPIGRDSDPVA